MTIHYCDWTNGSDATGDGSPQNPFKNIYKASEGLTGGDEVRIAKDPTPRAVISSPLTWTHNSRTVTGSGNLVSEIPQYSIIAKATAGGPGSFETVYEATTVTYNAGTNVTTITLGNSDWHRYSGDTGTVDSVVIAGTPTYTGEAKVHGVVSGTSKFSPIRVSGGWNLATEERDGETWFIYRDVNPSAKLRWGWSPKNSSWYHLSDVGFLRYNAGMVLGDFGTGCSFERVTAGASDREGVTAHKGQHDISFDQCVFSFGMIAAFCGINSASYTTYRNCLFTSSPVGLSLLYCSNTTLHGNSYRCCDVGIRGDRELATITNTYGDTFTSCAHHIGFTMGALSPYPRIIAHNYNGVSGDHRLFFETGTAMRDDTVYHSSSASWKLSPTQAHHPLSTVANQDDILIAPCHENRPLKLSVYLRKDSWFNGEVRLAAYISGGEVVAPQVVTISSVDAWEKHSITIPANQIHETGPVAALRVYVRGNAGNVWIDTLEWE